MGWWIGFGFGRRRGRGRGGPGPCWWYWYTQFYGGNIPNQIPWNWGFGRRWWWSYGTYNFQNVPNLSVSNVGQTPLSGDLKSIVERTKNTLKNSYVVEPFPGAPWMQIVSNGNIVGYVWERVNIKDLDVGNPINNGSYWSVPLLRKGRIVGYLYL